MIKMETCFFLNILCITVSCNKTFFATYLFIYLFIYFIWGIYIIFKIVLYMLIQAYIKQYKQFSKIS